MPRVLDRTLYVQEPGLNVELEAGAVQIEGNELQQKFRVPLHELEGVVIFGGVNLTQPLALRLADLGVPITYLTQRGDFRARLSGALEGGTLTRLNQYLASQDEAFLPKIASEFVAAKVHNAAKLLEGRGPTPEVQSLKAIRAQLLEATSVEHVLAFEAVAAQIYFAAFGRLFSPESGFTFQTRNRRPPKDPVNAMLSFGYVVLANDCEGALHAAGLDPNVGFLHAQRAGRASLANDLQEEFRAILVDTLVLNLANRRMVSPEQFETSPDGQGVHMGKEAMATFLEHYERRKQKQVNHPEHQGQIPMGLLPHVQSRLLARSLRDPERAYTGYRA